MTKKSTHIIKKILLATPLIVILCVGLLQIDDDINPQAQQWITEANSEKNSEAYYHLLGIYAAENENQKSLGQRLYQELKQSQENYINHKTEIVLNEYPEEKKIRLPKTKIFCKIWKTNCLKNIFNHKENISQLNKQYAILANRYQTFLSFNEFTTLSKPMLFEPVFAYQYLWPGHRLNSLNAIQQARAGEPQKAILRLTENIKQIKKKIKLADNIVGKVVFLSMLAEDLDLISIIAMKYNVTKTPQITLLTKAEYDFERPMKREIAMSYDLYRNMDKNPEFWQKGDTTPGWIVRSVFKPNMTLNKTVKGMFDIAEASHLNQKAFNTYANKYNEESTEQTVKNNTLESTISIRNYAGQILTSIATPNYLPFIAKLHDINVKMTLLNKINLLKTNKTEFYNLKNPYGLNDKPTLSKDNKHICFNGPYEDDQYFRCLTIKE